MGQDGIDQVIRAPLGGTHIQIIACAGSGKTEALARRVAYLLTKGIPPESIIAFTFTEKAAAELKQRIIDRSKQACGDSVLGSIGRMYVGTIHAYALQLLRTYVPRYANYDLIEEDALRAWVARHSKQILGTPEWTGLWDRISNFLGDADVVENEGIKPAGSDSFSQRYWRFVELLDSHRLLTFGQSIVKASDEIQRPSVRKQVHKEIRFVFVDEYQDINPAQERLIRGLVGKQTQLCVVGDDDQSIYQWRGSNVAIMQGFRKRYRPVLTVELNINRRSVPSIVAVASDFAETISPRLPKSIGSDRIELIDADPVRVLRPLNRAEEAETIASGIDALLKSGWHQSQIAILIRRWRQAEPILKALRTHDIGFDCGGGNSLFTTELGYLLAAGFLIGCGWSYVTYGWRQSHLPPPPESASEWVRQLGNLLHLSRAQRAEARAWIKSFSDEAQGEGTKPANLVADLHDLAAAIGVGTWSLENDEERLRFGTFARFSQVLASFEKARLSGRWIRDGKKTGFKGGQDRGAWFYRSLAYYLNGYALEASGGYIAPPDPASPAVQITTIHSAKGLQWPIVFLPGLEHKKFPSDKIGRIRSTEVPRRIVPKSLLARYSGSEADERRLFYVAMTRARDLLVVTCPQRANINRVYPSVFFEFAGDHPKAASPLKGIGSIPKRARSDSFKAPVPSLSFSELALYGSCPYAYRLATEFDIAKPIARDLGYGKSIHHILRRIADSVKASGKIPSTTTVEALFDSEFHVPFATAAGHVEMKSAARKLVFRYIGEWSNDLKSVWEVERPFELHLNGVIVAGRADVILDRNGGSRPKLIIVDYKSYDAKKTDQTIEHQLRTYTAAGRAEGFDVDGAVLHNLKKNTRDEIAVDPPLVTETLVRVTSWAKGIAAKEFPPKAAQKRCSGCDYNHVCQHRC